MKKLLILCVVMAGTVLPGWGQNDQVAIKKVLYDETEGFFKRDKEKWADCWAHTPYIYFAANLYGGDFTLIKGWDNMEKQFKSQFNSSRPADSVSIYNTNYEIHQNGKMAFVWYDQMLIDSHGKTTSKESRVVEKIGGKWKIIHVCALTNLANQTAQSGK
ncbi:hypothetical protein [Larkinella punicea]|uniref:Calcium/calmodulin-dependent protein kinase II association-domain domain-containing protein n=1 Tax=Larkinella punicea TaxID=2315727 RepID=A0A368JM38_9BACT|nr:hypothetical protein [Larkinella punicea]RCR68717.1 hypothetical protein DUE52_14640 [Larkinella punicea]